MSGIWTNNWRGYKNAMLLGRYKEGLTTVVDTSGNPISFSENLNDTVTGYSPFGAFHTNSYFTARAVFGTGSGTPAATDNTLFNRASDSVLSVTNIENGAVTYDVPGGSAERTVRVTVQNRSTTESITLTEWGIVLTLYYSPGDRRGSYTLVHHAMLDTPVTLIPQQTAVLELTLSVTLSDPV